MAALIHRWPLTVNANDVVGSLNLTNNGGVTFGPDGASFNGNSQWLSGTIVPPPIISMSIWVKHNAWGNTAQMAWGGASSITQSGFFMQSEGAYLTHHSNSYLFVGSELNSTNFPSSSHVLIVMTYDGTTLKYYRGGNLIASADKTTNTTLQTDFYIGRYSVGYYMNGKELDARIYDYALSAAEVSALAAAGPNPSDFTIPNPSPICIF